MSLPWFQHIDEFLLASDLLVDNGRMDVNMLVAHILALQILRDPRGLDGTGEHLTAVVAEMAASYAPLADTVGYSLRTLRIFVDREWSRHYQSFGTTGKNMIRRNYLSWFDEMLERLKSEEAFDLRTKFAAEEMRYTVISIRGYLDEKSISLLEACLAHRPDLLRNNIVDRFLSFFSSTRS